MLRLAVVVPVPPLAGCGTTNVQSPHAPSAAVSPVSAPVAGVADVVDRRGERTDWPGAIRGGYGDPVEIPRTATGPYATWCTRRRAAPWPRGLLAPAGSRRHDLRPTV